MILRSRPPTRKRHGVGKRCGGTGRGLRTGAAMFHKGLTRGQGVNRRRG